MPKRFRKRQRWETAKKALARGLLARPGLRVRAPIQPPALSFRTGKGGLGGGTEADGNAGEDLVPESSLQDKAEAVASGAAAAAGAGAGGS